MSKKNRLLAVLSYLYVLVIIPLIVGRKDEFVKFHSKQGVGLLFLSVIAPYILWIPILGWIIGPIFIAGILVLTVYGIIHAVKGEKKPLPIIGGFVEKTFY